MGSIFPIGISQNTKCDNLVSFAKSGHIISFERLGLPFGRTLDDEEITSIYHMQSKMNACCYYLHTYFGILPVKFVKVGVSQLWQMIVVMHPIKNS